MLSTWLSRTQPRPIASRLADTSGKQGGGGACCQSQIQLGKLREHCGAVTKPPDPSSNTSAQGTHKAPHQQGTQGGQARSNCGKLRKRVENCENCDKLRPSIPPPAATMLESGHCQDPSPKAAASVAPFTEFRVCPRDLHFVHKHT